MNLIGVCSKFVRVCSELAVVHEMNLTGACPVLDFCRPQLVHLRQRCLFRVILSLEQTQMLFLDLKESGDCCELASSLVESPEILELYFTKTFFSEQAQELG